MNKSGKYSLRIIPEDRSIERFTYNFEILALTPTNIGNAVQINWTAQGDNTVKVIRKDSKAGRTPTTHESGSTSFIDDTIKIGEKYNYEVFADSSGKETSVKTGCVS